MKYLRNLTLNLIQDSLKEHLTAFRLKKLFKRTVWTWQHMATKFGYMLFKKPEKYLFLHISLPLIMPNIFWYVSKMFVITYHAGNGGSGGQGGRAPPPPDFGRLVNPISTRGGRLCPPHFYLPPQIFRPSAIPVMYICSAKIRQ